MFLQKIYSVFLDGNFVGICENEDECWEVAQNHINGIDVLLDDDVDRVEWNEININKWYYHSEHNCSSISTNENVIINVVSDSKLAEIKFDFSNIQVAKITDLGKLGYALEGYKLLPNIKIVEEVENVEDVKEEGLELFIKLTSYTD